MTHVAVNDNHFLHGVLEIISVKGNSPVCTREVETRGGRLRDEPLGVNISGSCDVNTSIRRRKENEERVGKHETHIACSLNIYKRRYYSRL
jgi:hypothetical protein